MYTVTTDITKIQDMLLDPLKKEAPFILSHAMNTTLKTLKARQSKEINRYLDKNATKYTTNDNFYIPSTKRNLVAYYGWGYRSHYTPNLVQNTRVKPHKGTSLVEMNPNASKKFKSGDRLKRDIIKKIQAGQVKRGKVQSAFIGKRKGTFGAWELTDWRKTPSKNKGKRGGKKMNKARFHGIKLIAQMEDKSRMQNKKYPSYDLGINFINNRFRRQAISSMGYALKKYNSWMLSQTYNGGIY
jgi:hypothetical protein